MRIEELERNPLANLRRRGANAVKRWKESDPAEAKKELLTFIAEAEKAFPEETKAAKEIQEYLVSQTLKEITLKGKVDQLLWGLTLGYEFQKHDPQKPFDHHPLWMQLKHHPENETELSINQVFALNGGANPQTTMNWGEPHSWFFHNSKEQHINIDLMFAAVAGHENTRIIISHEIGHAEETREHPPIMQQLIQQAEALNQKQENTGLNAEEVGELTEMMAEIELRHKWNNICEDTAVNTFALDAGEKRYFQKLDQALFQIEYSVAGVTKIKDHAEKKDEPLPEQNGMAQYYTAARLSLMAELDYFDKNSPDAWREFGVHLDDGVKEIQATLCGEKGMCKMISPLQLNRKQWASKKIRSETQQQLCAIRGKIMEGLWDKYAKTEVKEQAKKAGKAARELAELAIQQGKQPQKVPTRIPKPGQEKVPKSTQREARGQPIISVQNKKLGQQQTNKTNRGKDYSEAGAKAGEYLDKLPVGDLTHYVETKKSWAGAIKKVEGKIQRIAEAQAEMKPRLNGTYSWLPDDDDIGGRLDAERTMNLRMQQKLGSRITQTDRAIFQESQNMPEPTTINLIIAIDCSGSMHGTPIEKALQTALIIYEATKKSPVKTWIMAWGPNNPPILADPTMKETDIQKNLSGLIKKGSLNTGTELAPAIVKINKTIGQTPLNPEEMVGYTHMFIISDGDINDKKNAGKALEITERIWKKVTTDVLLVNHHHSLIDELNDQGKLSRFSTCRSLTSGGIEMLNNCLQRIQKNRSMAVATPAYAEALAARLAAQKIEEELEPQKDR